MTSQSKNIVGFESGFIHYMNYDSKEASTIISKCLALSRKSPRISQNLGFTCKISKYLSKKDNLIFSWITTRKISDYLAGYRRISDFLEGSRRISDFLANAKQEVSRKDGDPSNSSGQFLPFSVSIFNF